ncbi:MAG: glycosyltransferase [Planctomycetota bacterium]
MTGALPRVLLVTAEPEGLVSGNNTTIERFARRLRAAGVEATLLRLPSFPDAAARLVAARAARPDVVHALHARHAGPEAVALARALDRPLVVTSGGTDLDQDVFDPARGAVVRATLAAARVLLVTHPAAEATARAMGLPLRVLRVPKGAEPPPPAPPADRARFGVRDDEVLFVLPAGVRPVKNNRFPLAPLTRLRAEGAPVRLLLAGPARDEAYAAALRADLAAAPFAAWPGTFTGADREVLYATADVVLNVSHSEGGANAVLEAMVRGACLLAASIPGNTVFLTPTATAPEAGRVYLAAPTDDPGRRRHDADDFLRHARDLAASPTLRRTLAAAARARARAEHDPAAEVAGLLDGYRVAVR